MFKPTNVAINTNVSDIGISIQHVDGKNVNLIIKADYGFFDAEGRLLAFTGVWEDGYTHLYTLAPIGFDVTPWVTGFLASFGVVSISGELRKKHPSGQMVAVQMATYFATSKVINPWIQSVADNFFGTQKLGYYNVKGELVFNTRFGGKIPTL